MVVFHQFKENKVTGYRYYEGGWGMANTNVNNSWEKIQLGVKDTERLIGQKNYNAAMIKSRQTLEFMVKLLSDRACLSDEGDLMKMIDALYQNRWISKTTFEHYHKIRMIGNKAVHEGDANAYNANQSYHMLSQEVYTFANDYKNAQRGTRRPATQSRSSSRSRKKRAAKSSAFSLYNLLRLMIPILCVILLICIIQLVKPPKSEDEETTTTPTTTTESVTATEPMVTTSAAPVPIVYKTAANLNVRPQPSKDGEPIGLLTGGTQVEYLEAYNEEWAKIMYNGQEAYVSSQFLVEE